MLKKETDVGRLAGLETGITPILKPIKKSHISVVVVVCFFFFACLFGFVVECYIIHTKNI